MILSLGCELLLLLLLLESSDIVRAIPQCLELDMHLLELINQISRHFKLVVVVLLIIAETTEELLAVNSAHFDS